MVHGFLLAFCLSVAWHCAAGACSLSKELLQLRPFGLAAQPLPGRGLLMAGVRSVPDGLHVGRR